MGSIYIHNKPEKTEFTKLYEDKSEQLKVEVCGVTNSVTITQYGEHHLYQLDRETVKWLVGILEDSIKLTKKEDES